MAIQNIEKKLLEFGRRVNGQADTVNQVMGERFVKESRNSVNQSIYKRPVFDAKGNPRQRKSWELTGNLINSIGYTKAIKGSISQSSSNKEGKDLGAALSKGIEDAGLIMLAGMSYGAAVESKGYDVISNSVNLIKDIYPKFLKKSLRL